MISRNKTTFVFIGLLTLFILIICADNVLSQATDANDTGEVLTVGQITELAEKDQIALLKKALENYRLRINDYRGTFLKKERIQDKLGLEQVMSFKFKENPFSVYMQWQENASAADKLLYVEGANDNEMLVHPTGFWSWVKSVRRAPRSKDTMKSTLNPCDEFGFERAIKKILKVYVIAQERGDLKIKSLGMTEVYGRKCIAIERTLPDKPEYPNAKLTIKIDVEYLVPLSIAADDHKGRLMGSYVYKDIEFNVGLTDKEFLPEENGL